MKLQFGFLFPLWFYSASNMKVWLFLVILGSADQNALRFPELPLLFPSMIAYWFILFVTYQVSTFSKTKAYVQSPKLSKINRKIRRFLKILRNSPPIIVQWIKYCSVNFRHFKFSMLHLESNYTIRLPRILITLQNIFTGNIY